MPPTTRVWLQRILSLQSPRALPRIFPIVSVILDDWWNCLNPQDTAVLLEKSGHWLNSTGRRIIELDKIYRATLPQTRISICCLKCGTCYTNFTYLHFPFQTAFGNSRTQSWQTSCIPTAQAPHSSEQSERLRRCLGRYRISYSGLSMFFHFRLNTDVF